MSKKPGGADPEPTATAPTETTAIEVKETTSQSPAPASATGATVVELDALRARIRGEVFAERAALARQVTEACAIAGVAQLAGILLADEGMTLEAARDRIQSARGAGGIEIHTAHAAGSTSDPEAPRFSTTDVYEKWNRGGKEKA